MSKKKKKSFKEAHLTHFDLGMVIMYVNNKYILISLFWSIKYTTESVLLYMLILISCFWQKSSEFQNVLWTVIVALKFPCSILLSIKVSKDFTEILNTIEVRLTSLCLARKKL